MDLTHPIHYATHGIMQQACVGAIHFTLHIQRFSTMGLKSQSQLGAV